MLAGLSIPVGADFPTASRPSLGFDFLAGLRVQLAIWELLHLIEMHLDKLSEGNGSVEVGIDPDLAANFFAGITLHVVHLELG